MADPDHPRLVLRNFLCPAECKELQFIHNSCCTVGYIPNVFSTTLSHLIATNCSHLIMPFVTIRERLKEKAEDFFGCEYELCIEFTGLISWSKGASIGWHSDDNRSYIKQRDFTAVCYLNDHGVDFTGGLFHFKDGEPTTIVPMAGDLVMYTADSRNIHSVDEITDGERLTLTLWFSRDSSHDEDAKLISLLSRNQLKLNSLYSKTISYLPLPGSSNMYWFPANQASEFESGFDIRCARLHNLGYDLYSSLNPSFSETHSSSDFSEQLMKPLHLVRDDKMIDKDFVNILHVLQVVQYYSWKRLDLQTSGTDRKTHNVVRISQVEKDKICQLKCLFLKDDCLAKSVFGHATRGQCLQFVFDWARFSAAIEAWEAYSCRLLEEMLTCLQYWRTYQSVFSYPR